jgi:hypothetical protein
VFKIPPALGPGITRTMKIDPPYFLSEMSTRQIDVIAKSGYLEFTLGNRSCLSATPHSAAGLTDLKQVSCQLIF